MAPPVMPVVSWSQEEWAQCGKTVRSVLTEAYDFLKKDRPVRLVEMGGRQPPQIVFQVEGRMYRGGISDPTTWDAACSFYYAWIQGASAHMAVAERTLYQVLRRVTAPPPPTRPAPTPEVPLHRVKFARGQVVKVIASVTVEEESMAVMGDKGDGYMKLEEGDHLLIDYVGEEGVLFGVNDPDVYENPCYLGWLHGSYHQPGAMTAGYVRSSISGWFPVSAVEAL